jgi:signal transduction histidine kinase
MLRRISTKLVVAVLAAVVLPFVAFAIFIDHQMAERLTRNVVQQSLKGQAKDLAGQVDRFVEERRQDVQQWAGNPLATWAVDDYDLWLGVERARRDGREVPDQGRPWNADSMLLWMEGKATLDVIDPRYSNRTRLTREFDRWVELQEVYDLLLLVAEDGTLVTCSSHGPDGEPLDADLLRALFDRDFLQESWFADAVGGRLVEVDNHRSPYGLYGAVPGGDEARRHHIGFAAPVRWEADEVRGVLFALVNWTHLEELVSGAELKDVFRGLVPEGDDPSPYAWIWDSDADTIIGHPDRSLYGKSITRDVELPELADAARTNTEGWGLYPEYNFRGVWKNAAFKRTREPELGGFGWVVGVGINNDDIYATSKELQRLLMGGTAIMLLMATGWTLLIARKTTAPIEELRRTTRRVARGDLDVRIELNSRDELGELARDFNTMTAELEGQRAKLVKAEKDAAWREMARQIAHDIKNPLTPIKLSLDLLERARDEGSENFDEILERTMGLIGRQVGHLREIAGDFYEFTGGSRMNPSEVDIGELIGEVLSLHDAWAVELGVDIQSEGLGGTVWADLEKLRRVFVNLVTNALQAMPDGGSLRVEAAPRGELMRVTIRDTGPGISSEVREHLFEPYFTTKGEGTGLGLAISKRVVEAMGGTISLDSVEDGAGTLATVELPLHDGQVPQDGADA